MFDKRGRSQWSNNENGYWLQVSVDARAASVVWRMHPTISPSGERMPTLLEVTDDDN